MHQGSPGTADVMIKKKKITSEIQKTACISRKTWNLSNVGIQNGQVAAACYQTNEFSL